MKIFFHVDMTTINHFTERKWNPDYFPFITELYFFPFRTDFFPFRTDFFSYQKDSFLNQKIIFQLVKIFFSNTQNIF